MEERQGMRRAAAWGVHLYTALGLPLAFLAADALFIGEPTRFFTVLWAALAVDASDGILARAVKVGEVLPELDGRRLDDLVDFLNYAFLPALSFVYFGTLPSGMEAAAVVPLVASGYGFCQERAKTEESFVGFPSYWNVLALYLYVLEVDPWWSLAFVLLLSVMVFVPIRYLYPTKTRMLKRTTLILSAAWWAATLVLALNADAGWAPRLALASLVFPVYYVVVSLLHHWRET